MSEREVIANQAKILRNQMRLLANQQKLDRVLENQKAIKANQAASSPTSGSSIRCFATRSESKEIRPRSWPTSGGFWLDSYDARAARLFVRPISIRFAMGPTMKSA